ncbi:lytic transglycosylase domain-containing protein [Litchfieldella rifensis]|uniref:Lytic transglycosylase domain-containing protein n=1 Tax=Litchfieldella rifensis TaxID=762643 RepID=A0ABV7LMM8_9GAMM
MFLPWASLAAAQGNIPDRDAISSALRDTLDSALDRSLTPQRIWASRQWLTAMEPRLARFVPDVSRRHRLLESVYREAQLAGLAPEIVLAVIQVESAFTVDAVSSAGARGLMQIMPFWVRELGRPDDDLFDPPLNLRYGCTILAHYLAIEGGDLTRALARYHGSRDQTGYPERVMRAWTRHWWIQR